MRRGIKHKFGDVLSRPGESRTFFFLSLRPSWKKCQTQRWSISISLTSFSMLALLPQKVLQAQHELLLPLLPPPLLHLMRHLKTFLNKRSLLMSSPYTPEMVIKKIRNCFWTFSLSRLGFIRCSALVLVKWKTWKKFILSSAFTTFWWFHFLGYKASNWYWEWNWKVRRILRRLIGMDLKFVLIASFHQRDWKKTLASPQTPLSNRSFAETCNFG
jgi:hypothetical protein